MHSSTKILIGCAISLSVCTVGMLLIESIPSSAETKQPTKTVQTQKKKSNHKKYELIAINIYNRNVTDNFGRIIDTEDCIRIYTNKENNYEKSKNSKNRRNLGYKQRVYKFT